MMRRELRSRLPGCPVLGFVLAVVGCASHADQVDGDGYRPPWVDSRPAVTQGGGSKGVDGIESLEHLVAADEPYPAPGSDAKSAPTVSQSGGATDRDAATNEVEK